MPVSDGVYVLIVDTQLFHFFSFWLWLLTGCLRSIHTLTKRLFAFFARPPANILLLHEPLVLDFNVVCLIWLLRVQLFLVGFKCEPILSQESLVIEIEFNVRMLEELLDRKSLVFIMLDQSA